MLIFVGLGLYDHRDVSVKGLMCIRNADRVYLEQYTSRLMGTTVAAMEAYYEKEVQLLTREEVESHPHDLLSHAAREEVVILAAGDPMVSTTHIDLRMRAAAAGIGTRIIHGASIQAAVCGLCGLQNYRFGKSCSLPFPSGNWFPTTPIDVVAANLSLDLHTLVYLDIQDERYMSVHQAIDLLEKMGEKTQCRIPLYIGIARAGSDEPVVAAGAGDRLREIDFGPPLHILAIPGSLHVMEREYLERFACL
jgi:diphthine synthase